MATIRDVARKADVSIATVSRVMNAPDQVNEKMRAAVLHAIDELNYRPNRAAQALKRQESHTIGFALSQFSAPYYGLVLDGIDEALVEVGFKTIAENGRETPDSQVEAWMSLVERQCESVILHGDLIEEATLRRLMDAYPTTVLLNQVLTGFEDRCIVVDNYAAGRLAADYLLGQGHRDIAVFTGPVDRQETYNRHAGFVARLAEAGVALNPKLVRNGWFVEKEAEQIMAEFIDQKEPFTVLFSQNDVMAAGAMEACNVKGIKVPDEISIMGFDDLDLARYLTPKLTTIRQPVHRIGRAAAMLAYRLCRPDISATVPIQIRFEATLVERGSVAHIAT